MNDAEDNLYLWVVIICGLSKRDESQKRGPFYNIVVSDDSHAQSSR